MTSMEQDRSRRRVVIGVDTHKYVHVAVALDANGGAIDSRSFAADSGGYVQLIDWATNLRGAMLTFAIEGTGSYGAGSNICGAPGRHRRSRGNAHRSARPQAAR